ncbi:MAG: hypothetical protein M1438_00225 [Deltaproteobacteria bacterium]|nr:hypothetical protein [Deltaproteobacteria bacterium]
MKKTILILLVLALIVPSAALATEFSLGGYIKLQSYWESTQNSTFPLVALARNNDAGFKHGNFHVTAAESRYNFTIKGPDLWGAKTTAFIEVDWESNYDFNISGVTGAAGPNSISNAYQQRLRHAMFRMNWPETELMFGQYWGMFSEYVPEVTNDGVLTFHGWAYQRTPQIRLTQKFAGDWTVAAAIMEPYSPTSVDANFNTTGATNFPVGSSGSTYLAGGATFPAGRNAETPQIQAKIQYEKDLWGKAAYWGRPRGFAAQLTGGWQRLDYRTNVTPTALSTLGQNAFGATTNSIQNGQQYLDPWAIQASLFIPVLPTYSNNLAGTASIVTQWWIGQGVSSFGLGRDQDNSWFDFSGRNTVGQFVYNRKLTNQFGGWIQGQYYFNNQWFLTVDWGIAKTYGQDLSTSALLTGQQAGNVAGIKYATNNDQMKVWQEYDVALYYRPIQALKFGISYMYERTDYLQKVNNPTGVGTPPASQNATATGDSHRIAFVAWMFF